MSRLDWAVKVVDRQMVREENMEVQVKREIAIMNF
jgi:hypothetical protein